VKEASKEDIVDDVEGDVKRFDLSRQDAQVER